MKKYKIGLLSIVTLLGGVSVKDIEVSASNVNLTLKETSETIYIPDFNLKHAINSYLGKSEDYSPTIEELESILALDVSEQKVKGLEGLQYAKNLYSLRLNNGDNTEGETLEFKFYQAFEDARNPSSYSVKVTVPVKFIEETGQQKIGWLKENKSWYYYKESGEMATGWEKISGTWYYFNPSGKMQTGWLKEGSTWYYLKSSGAMATGWEKVSGAWYYFNSSGKMQTGWLKEGSTWYYLKSSGAMAISWEHVNGTWYYFNPSGKMQTGWLKEGNTWYYLKSSGAMAIGWEHVNGTWYYFNPSGEMQTGWLKEGNTWYYLKSSGAMATGWLKEGSKWYYFNSNGSLVTGIKKIDGKYYYFNSAGVMEKNLGISFDVNKYNQLISSGKSTSYALNYVLYPNVKTNFYNDIKVLKNPSSITVLVNKNYQLPSNYVPSDLVLLDVPLYNNSSSNLANYMRKEAAVALKKMFNAAKSKGYKLVARSGYRSYNTQKSLYSNYVSTKGKLWADQYSARPGHSEHQTGLAIDITSPTVNNSLSDSFGKTAEGKWVAQNAHRFGYILRYPKGRKSEVGYEYEPWHLRYVGVQTATEIYNKGLIYEDYILEKGLIPRVK